MAVRSLSRKYDQLMPMLRAERVSYAAMVESADSALIKKWSNKMEAAQKRRVKNVKVMDAFDVELGKGESAQSQLMPEKLITQSSSHTKRHTA